MSLAPVMNLDDFRAEAAVKMVTLGDLIDEYGGLIQTGPFGSQLHQRDYTEHGVPVVMPKDIRAGRIDESTVARVSEQKATELARHYLKPGSIVFPRRGEIGKCAYVDGYTERFLCGTGCMKIEPPTEILEPQFVYYYLSLPRVVEWLERNAVGTTMLNLNTKIIGRIHLPILPLRHQRRVISILSTYDRAIENNRRRIALLEKAAQLIYRDWFVRFRFPGHEYVGKTDGLPKTWKRVTAFEVMDVLSGGTPDTKNPHYWNGEIPFFTPKDVSAGTYVLFTEKYLSEEGLRNCNSRLYPKDTVFITARGTVGKLALAQTEMAMSQSCYALTVANPMNQFFLYLALLNGVEQLRSRAFGSIFSAITRNTFRTIPFIVPEKRTIGMFTDIVSPIFRHIEILSLEMRKLAEARDLLLPRLMNGRVPV